MFQVEGLSVAYGGRVLFDDVCFSVQGEERCGVVGRNGTGKSTLLRILAGKERPSAGTIVAPKHYRVAMLDQHLDFRHATVLAEAASSLPPDEKDHLYKAERVLFGLGFGERDMDRPIKEFSGGYQLRLHLAKALISEPDCLLLDEPTNYLDIVSVRWFTRFLQQWRKEFLLISHDREFMDNVTTHTMGIHRQKVSKVRGGTTLFYERLLAEEEVYEKTRQSVEKKRAQAQGFIDRFGAKATKAAQAQSRKKQLERLPVLEKLQELYNLSFRFAQAPFPGRKMVDAAQVCFGYVPGQEIIRELSLVIEKGERIAIIGKNGRGKSTLLRLLAKELEPQSGSAALADNVKPGYFGQTNIDRLDPAKSIVEEVASANPLLTHMQARSVCGVMMFGGDQSDKPIGVLSGGEKSRVLLGKILATPCNLLLLDEPTHHLDMESIESLIDALEEFDGAVVIVSHSELLLRRLCLDKIIVCHEGGQDLFWGDYDSFLETKGWPEEGAATAKKSGKNKEHRQKRAELIAERAQAVRPIEKAIGSLEAELLALEVAQGQDTERMAQLAASADGPQIQALAKAMALRAQAIDDAYGRLDRLLAERDAVAKSYDERLEH